MKIAVLTTNVDLLKLFPQTSFLSTFTKFVALKKAPYGNKSVLVWYCDHAYYCIAILIQSVI